MLGEQQLNPSQVLLQHRDLLVRLQNHLQPQLYMYCFRKSTASLARRTFRHAFMVTVPSSNIAWEQKPGCHRHLGSLPYFSIIFLIQRSIWLKDKLLWPSASKWKMNTKKHSWSTQWVTIRKYQKNREWTSFKEAWMPDLTAILKVLFHSPSRNTMEVEHKRQPLHSTTNHSPTVASTIMTAILTQCLGIFWHSLRILIE